MKTIIKNSIFSRNRIYYSNNYQTGAALYISSQNEDIFLENTNFIENSLCPASEIDWVQSIGGACLRTSGNNVNLIVNYSIFKGNNAIFDSTCIEFYGNNLTVNSSLFQENTNLIIPIAKYGPNIFGYGAIFTICQNIIIDFSFFIENMNYFGGTFFIDGSPEIQDLYISKWELVQFH